jgi:PAS domain S-box-containing protein
MGRSAEGRAPPGAAERLWELSSDLMAVTDMDGQVLAVNGAWQAVLDWTEAELMRGIDLLHPDDAEAVVAEKARVREGATTMNFESRLRARDGGYRRFSWRAFADGGHMHVVGRDITEQRRREEAARHAQKMEAIGELTGGIAHDFNNLLTIVRSAVDLLKNPDLPETRRRRYVDAIDDAVERATRVTQQLLAFARRQKLDPERFDVAERIADVSELLRQVVGPRIRISTGVTAGHCHVEADLCQFETALMNLAINARDAMEGEGALAIECSIVDEIPAMRDHAAAEGKFVAVTVRDTGVGIAPELLPRIFEPFYSTKETGKGTGLGLSQVYGFAKQSGGAVGVQSEHGVGAAFTVYLPRSRPAEGAAAERIERTSREEASAPEALHALVVEDNEDVGAFCVGMMQDLGYRPDWARNAREALDALAQDDADYDLVFSDVVMPGMSGIELAERIRETHPSLPVLLTSGYSAVLAQEGSRGFPLLAKPYSARELETALSRILPHGGPTASSHIRH